MAQDARPTWDSLCDHYRFLSCAQVTQSTTFGQAYTGANFKGDFRDILVAVDQVLRPHAATPPPYDGDDLMIGSLENYPDDPPG